MKHEAGDMTAQEMTDHVSINEIVHFKSKFGFLSNIKGLRPGETHMVLAASGGGKSTLMRSLLMDLQESRPKILLWLTEESAFQFKTAMSYSRTTIENLIIISEPDNDFPIRNISKMNEAIELHQPDVFILDNLTANMSYEILNPKQQTQYVLWLKKICMNSGIPFLCFAHTNMSESELRNREIGLNDVRGGKGVAMLFEFVFTLQSFMVNAGFDPVKNAEIHKRINKLAIIKNRTQTAAYQYFHLKFDAEKKTYTSDQNLTGGQFKKIWKEKVV